MDTNYQKLEKKRIIIKLKGGLGNQMFQYAFYMFLVNQGANIRFRISNNSNDFHHGVELEKVFGIRLPLITFSQLIQLKIDSLFLRLFKKTLFFNRIIENDDNCASAQVIDKICKNRCVYLDGYFQNESFFRSIKNHVISDFEFKFQLSDQQQNIYNIIQSTESVSIHIRRGDYLNHKSRYSNIASLEYYHRSLEYINERIENPIFFVFSDDLEWCKKNIEYPSLVFVDCNNNAAAYCDMYFMSQCKHNIIANSTFSWWAAYLNQNKEKYVIRPNKFVNLDALHAKNNIYISNWINIK